MSQTDKVKLAELKEYDNRSPHHSEKEASVHNESPKEEVVQTSQRDEHHQEKVVSPIASPHAIPAVNASDDHHEESKGSHRQSDITPTVQAEKSSRVVVDHHEV